MQQPRRFLISDLYFLQVLDGVHRPEDLEALVSRVKAHEAGTAEDRRAALFTKFKLSGNQEYAQPGLSFPLQSR